MFPPLTSIRAALVRAGLWPRPLWWLGKPRWVTIAPTAGGYVLQIHHTQGVEWVDLPPRTGTFDRPDAREFTAASAALAVRGLVWELPWLLDRSGHLTALVTRTGADHAHPAFTAFPQLNPFTDPDTTSRSEDRR
jgi:hypothetical protein